MYYHRGAEGPPGEVNDRYTISFLSCFLWLHGQLYMGWFFWLPPRSAEKARLCVSRTIYVNVDSPNLGFPYLNFLGGYQWKKSPCIKHALITTDKTQPNPLEKTEFNAPETPDPLEAADMKKHRDTQSLGKAFDYQQTCTWAVATFAISQGCTPCISWSLFKTEMSEDSESARLWKHAKLVELWNLFTTSTHWFYLKTSPTRNTFFLAESLS